MFAQVEEQPNNIFFFSLHGNPTWDVFESELLNKFSELLRSGPKIAFIIDASDVTGMSVSIAKQTAKWMKTNKPLIKEKLVCTGLCIPNEVVKGMLDLVLSVQKPTAPLKVFEELEGAQSFSETMMTASLRSYDGDDSDKTDTDSESDDL